MPKAKLKLGKGSNVITSFLSPPFDAIIAPIFNLSSIFKKKVKKTHRQNSTIVNVNL